MPFRGLLFKKILATKSQRQAIEKKQLSEHFKKQSNEISKLRKRRIQEEGKAKLRNLLAEEKRKLKVAKSTTKLSRLEGFLAKEAKKGARFTAHKSLKLAKKTLTKKKRRTRRRRRRSRRR